MTENPAGSAAHERVPCPECEGTGNVIAEYVYRNGDRADLRAECPYCGGAGEALRGAVERDGY